jgi:hypothetical protein
MGEVTTPSEMRFSKNDFVSLAKCEMDLKAKPIRPSDGKLANLNLGENRLAAPNVWFFTYG